MQSSRIIAVRAGVLLSALVAIPAIALFGMPGAGSNRPHRPSSTRYRSLAVSPPERERPAVDNVSGDEALGDRIARPQPPVARAQPADRGLAVSALPVEMPTERALAKSLESSPAAANPFETVQTHLREMGATYYSLETWGDEGLDFRFLCRVSLSGDASEARHFEAIADDPMRAMTRVAGEVEQWRGTLSLALSSDGFPVR